MVGKRRVKPGVSSRTAIDRWLAHCETEAAEERLSASKLRRYKSSMVRWKPDLYRITVRGITKKALADYVPWRFATTVKAQPSVRSFAIDFEVVHAGSAGASIKA